jgi:hypothetical protein
MLAVQMVATHDLAMQALGNARRQGSEPQAQHTMGVAISLLKMYALEGEALATLRGKRRGRLRVDRNRLGRRRERGRLASP